MFLLAIAGIGLTVAAIGCTAGSGTLRGTGDGRVSEFPIVTEPLTQTLAVVSGSTVVWHDDRDDTVWMRDLTSEDEPIPLVDWSPMDMADGFVVGIGSVKGVLAFHIYGYNLTQQKSFSIADRVPVTLGLATCNEHLGAYPFPLPSTSGGIVVWPVHVDDDFGYGRDVIFMYDLTANEGPEILVRADHVQGKLAISHDFVVWEDCGDIVGYHLGSQEHIKISSHPGKEQAPDVANNVVVWQDDRNGNWDIYGYDLQTNTEFQITTDDSDQQFPAVSDHFVVWEDKRNGNTDIFGYNLATRTVFPIAIDPSEQTGVEISGNIVVWVDTRNGNGDIYGADLK